MGNSDDPRIWKQNLSTWSLRLIEDISQMQVNPSDSSESYSEFILNLFKSLFIIRENEILWSSTGERTSFSRLIQDIPSIAGKMAVLEQLVYFYPDETHFRAHFARLLSFQNDEHQRALVEINKALEKDDKDNVLHHIKGMILWRSANALIKDLKSKKNQSQDFFESTAQEISTLIQQAETEFTTTRELSPDNEYAYVSHIQLLVNAVEFGSFKEGKNNIQQFLADQSTIVYQEMVERAEILLAELKRLRGDRSSN